MAGDWERAGVSGMGLQVLEKIKLPLISLWRQILGMGEHDVHIEEDESSREHAKPVVGHHQVGIRRTHTSILNTKLTMQIEEEADRNTEHAIAMQGISDQIGIRGTHTSILYTELTMQTKEEDDRNTEHAIAMDGISDQEGGGSLSEKEMKKELKTFAYWTLSISMAGNITLLTLELNPQLFWIIRLTSILFTAMAILGNVMLVITDWHIYSHPSRNTRVKALRLMHHAVMGLVCIFIITTNIAVQLFYSKAHK